MRKELDTPEEAEFREQIREDLTKIKFNRPFTQKLETNPSIKYIPRELLMTDIGNSIRCLNQENQNIRFARGVGFCVWNGQHWETDADHLVQEKIIATHETMIEEISSFSTDAKERKRMAEWVQQSNNQSRIKAVMSLLEKNRSIRIDSNILDQNDWLMNFQNGTLNLKTGILQDFSRLDYISQILPYEYDPDAKCPQWERFIAQILADPHEANWVQKVAGYTLTGDTSGQFFMFCFGVGGNGKGILLQTLMEMMGPYSCSLPSESFMMKINDGGVPNDIAGIRGARLVVASEVPTGKKWNEALLKQLTGSDPVKARFLRQEFFTFQPKCKIWISGNPRPAISDPGSSFWRRIKLVEFKQIFTNPDTYLADRLRTELPGIFTWALKGLQEAMQHKEGLVKGLKPPASIEAETEEYRKENDTVSRFIQDMCVIDKSGVLNIPAQKAFSEYYEWCKEQGEVSNMLNSKEFPKKMIALGFEKKKLKTHNAFMGIGLDNDPPSNEAKGGRSKDDNDSDENSHF